MAITLSLFPTSNNHHNNHPQFSSQSKQFLKPKIQSLPLSNPNFNNNSNPTNSFSISNSSNNSQKTHKTPSKFNLFLTQNELKNLEILQNFTYSHKLPSGYLKIRAMNDLEVDIIVELLAESFNEAMLLPNMYLTILGFLVKRYLVERRSLIPNVVTLIGFLKIDDDNDFDVLVGTVEVSFNRKGSNVNPPTPLPPKDFPYICNMTVKKEFRRRGIGWHLLKASEEIISNMTSAREVFLHCRLVDTAPFTMYIKAGYEVVKTDSFLTLLTLQRRKHLMCKELPIVSKPVKTVITEDDEVPSLVAGSESKPLDEEVPSFVARSESERLLPDEVVKYSPDMGK